jgi:Protein of unknown function (DUF2380)
MTEWRWGRSAVGAIYLVMAAADLSCGGGAARRSSVAAPKPAPARAAAPAPALPQVVVAVPDIFFTDSSTEEVDQTAAHEARLKSMVDGLRADVASSKRFAARSLTCGRASCADGRSSLDDLRREARAAGARLLLLAGVTKMSTLILWMNVSVVDVASGERVLVRVISFRGDNDDAWRRAGSFVAKQVVEELEKSPPKP